MSAAFFALGGAIIGVLGTVLTELVRDRRDDQKLWREQFRSICAEFVGEITRLQDLSHQLRRTPGDAELQAAAQETLSRVRSQEERLRLTSKSVPTQEAARWLEHCIYYQWRSTQGAEADFWQARKEARTWLAKFNTEARKELGLAGSALYQDPPDGFPVPGGESHRPQHPDRPAEAGAT